MEIWKPAPGYEDQYEVSNFGKLKTLGHKTFIKRNKYLNRKDHVYFAEYKSKILKPYKSKGGYLIWAPQINKKRKKILVHRLVGFAFVPGHFPGAHINHINNNKLDNRVENLEWITNSINVQKAWQDGFHDNLKGDSNPGSKLSSKQVFYIRKMLNFGVIPHWISIVSGVSAANIYLIRDGKRWSEIIF